MVAAANGHTEIARILVANGSHIGYVDDVSVQHKRDVPAQLLTSSSTLFIRSRISYAEWTHVPHDRGRQWSHRHRPSTH
jgi:hypothetical protein